MEPRPGDLPIVFSTTWCGHCTRLKQQLDRLRVPYEGVDVDEHDQYLPWLAEVNGGSWLIPTVLLPDGGVLVNPPAHEVAARVAVDGSPPTGQEAGADEHVG